MADAKSSQEALICSQMQDWSIVVDASAIPAERYAAEELQRLFEQATGSKLPIQNEATSGTSNIYVGPDAAKQSGLISNLDEMSEEGLRVVVQQGGIAIAGGQPRGTLYGVYQFLEDNLGVRPLTHDHIHAPNGADGKIMCGDFSYSPPFSVRWSYYRENSQYPEHAARLRVNTVSDDETYGGKTGQSLINHSFHWLVPFSQYGEEHPEYYALHEGKRDTETGGGGPQLCVTNEEVIQIAAASVLNFLEQHPDAENVSVSQADTARYCRCPRCEELNEREGTPMGSQLTFVNRVAEIVEKEYPDVKIGTLAYWYTRQAPKTIRPRGNIQIQLCSIECCTLHPLDDPDCPKNQAFCHDMNSWAAMSDDIWVWNYNTNFRYYDLPFPNLRSIGPNVRYFQRSNTKGLFMQANGNGLTGEFSDLRNYLIARMIWDPSADDQAVLREFVQLHYQEAAPPILEYIQFFHDNAEASGQHPTCFPSPEQVGLNPDVAHKIYGYFEQATHLAKDEAVKARVEKASIPAYRALLEVKDALDADKRPEFIERYITLAQRHGMTHAAEHKAADVFFGELRGDGKS